MTWPASPGLSLPVSEVTLHLAALLHLLRIQVLGRGAQPRTLGGALDASQ